MSTFNTGLNSDLSLALLGKPGGFAPLDLDQKIPSIFLPASTEGGSGDDDYLRFFIKTGVPYNSDLGNFEGASIIQGVLAIGEQVTCDGFSSICLGYNSEVNGDNSIVISGESGNVFGADSVAIGYTSQVEADNSITIGSGSYTDSNNSIVVGKDSYIENSNGSIILGVDCLALDSSRSIALGFEAEIESSAVNSVQIGKGSNQTSNTIQYLDNTIANSDGSVIPLQGAYSDDTDAGNNGVTSGQYYQTNGLGSAPLNVAGIVMVKQ